jgi:hypothetical protein
VPRVIPFLDIGSGRPVLVVPDVHQDLHFLERCAALAVREGAMLCFLGDHVDAINPRWQGEPALRAVAERLPELAEAHGPGCVFLAGNHDVEALRLAKLRALRLLKGEDDFVAQMDAASPLAAAYTRLLGAWPSAFLRSWGLAATAYGYLLSHAGVSRRLWPWGAGPKSEAQITAFISQANEDWARWLETGEESPLFAAGPARGGRQAPVGGLIWLDWDEEFVDDLPLPQLVGHTRGRDARRKDRSWCLDACQSAAALLDPDLGLRVVRV